MAQYGTEVSKQCLLDQVEAPLAPVSLFERHHVGDTVHRVVFVPFLANTW